MSTIALSSKKSKSRHRKLLENKNVKRWHDNLSRGSRVTAYMRLQRLSTFCERNNITPEGIILLGKKDIEKLDDLLLDDVLYLEQNNKAPSYVEDILKAIKSWASFNYVDLRRKIKIKNSGIPVTLNDEVVPTRQKLDEVLDSSDPRAKICICMMAFAGVRPAVLGNDNGTDGLVLSDIKGLHVKPDGTVSFDKIPATVVVRYSISKAKHEYFTKLPKIGCDALAGYLRERMNHKEILHEKSPVITVDYGYKNRGKHISTKGFVVTTTISSIIRKAFGETIEDRPYVLRSYFDTNLLIAENRGKIAHAMRQFFMGHKGDIEATYTINKKTLPEALLKEIDQAYINSLPYLLQEEEQSNEKSKQDMFLDVIKEQAKIFGVDPDKLQIAEKQKNTKDQLESIKKLVSEKFNENKNLPNQKQSRIIAGEDNLLTAMNDGYDLVKELSGNRFLVR